MAIGSGRANPTLMKKQMAMVKISTQMNASSLRAPHACKNKNVNVSAPVTGCLICMLLTVCGLCRRVLFYEGEDRCRKLA